VVTIGRELDMCMRSDQSADLAVQRHRMISQVIVDKTAADAIVVIVTGVAAQLQRIPAFFN